jgi:hypothetical protein
MCLSLNFQTPLEGLTTLRLGLMENSRVEELYVHFVERYTDFAELCFQEVDMLDR